MSLAYCQRDAENTILIYNQMRKYNIQEKIEKLREKIDTCDDMYLRENLARQLKYLRAQLD